MKYSFFTSLLAATSAVNAYSSSGYAPQVGDCPSSNSSLIREGDDISSEEKQWVELRQLKTDEALKEYLERVGMEDLDIDSLFGESKNKSISLGLAFAGGSYRAMLTGAGQLAALDNRTTDATDYALGGLLQGATYIAALSGGGWMLSSIIAQNMTTVEDIIDENDANLWNLTYYNQLINYTALTSVADLALPLLGGKYTEAFEYLNYWNGTDGIGAEIAAKEAVGFPTTLTDVWSRALARQMFPRDADNFLAGYAFSDLQEWPIFSEQNMPFPILVAVGRRPGTTVYNMNSTVVEFNPFEMGSFDTSLNSFTKLKYIGTSVDNGYPTNSTCVTGFDNSAFIMGTSSSLFNEFVNTLTCDSCVSTLSTFYKSTLNTVLESLSAQGMDIAQYYPNPFFNSQYATSENITKNDTLYLMDGGLGGEVIPLSSLMTKDRALDVVMAFDYDTGTNVSWPAGDSLINTYERQFTDQGKSSLCPYVPDQSTFIHFNLTAKPTFFGCDASNLTALAKDGVVPPLVIYMANRPFEFYSNTSTLKLYYNDTERDSMVANGFDIVSQNNGTIDSEWAACVGCAIIRREQERQGVEQSEQCKQCFANYCWDGSLATNDDYATAFVNFTDTGLTNDDTVFYSTSVTPKDYGDESSSSNSTSSSSGSSNSSSTTNSTSSSSSAVSSSSSSTKASSAMAHVPSLMVALLLAMMAIV